MYRVIADVETHLIARTGAALIDAAVVTLPVALFTPMGVISAVPVGLLLAYRLVLHSSCGWTVGKRLVGLKVIDRGTGRKPGVVQAAKRDSWYLAALLAMAVAELLLLFIPTGRTVGHLLVTYVVGASTVVVVCALYLFEIARQGYTDGDSFAGTVVVPATR